MADSDPGPGPVTEPAPPPSDEGAPRDWGRVLDAAGAAAGIVLALIVVDIWTDGRLVSRRLQAWRARPRGGETVEPEH